jgi:hypothetical protein
MATEPEKATARTARVRKGNGGETHQIADDVVLTAGVTDLDGDHVKVGSRATAERVGEACRALRFWERSV